MFLKIERFASTMGIGGNPAASEALRQARAFADSGDFDKALEKHEWYHEHAVEVDPSQRGVRLSFALNSWIQLGAKYPPALASLKTICDDNEKALLKGGEADPKLLQDFQAINRALLKSNHKTVELFQVLDTEHPTFAKECFPYVQDVLLEEKSVDLFGKYMDDIHAYLEKLIERHQSLVKILKEKHDQVPEQATKRFDDKLVSTTLELAELAFKKGEQAMAANLKEMTFRQVPDERLKPDSDA